MVCINADAVQSTLREEQGRLQYAMYKGECGFPVFVTVSTVCTSVRRAVGPQRTHHWTTTARVRQLFVVLECAVSVAGSG